MFDDSANNAEPRSREKNMVKVYLANLAYDTVVVNAAVPLNIGYVAAHLNQVYGDNVQTSLFKYPTELENALKTSPPDVLGVSNYS